MQLIDFSLMIVIEMTWCRVFGAMVEVYNLNYFIFSWLRGLLGLLSLSGMSSSILGTSQLWPNS